MTTTSRLLLALALSVVAAVGVTGCAASPSGGGSSADRAAVQEEAPAGADPAPVDSAVVITGRILITTEDPIAAADRATTIAVDAGGRVDARTEHASDEGDSASADLTLRIPADEVESARTALRELGTVEETSWESAEVGVARRDLEARIATLQTSLARYAQWLGAADKTSDLIELEKAIAERQTELERLRSEHDDLEDQISMSTISLNLRSEYTPPVTAPANIGEAIAIGWSGFAGFWGAAFISLGVALPWLLLLALLAGGIVWLVARRRQGAASSPTPPPIPHAPLFTTGGASGAAEDIFPTASAVPAMVSEPADGERTPPPQ